MGRGRGWLHCAFSCSVSADGSCWALCCIPLAPHPCLMERGQSILNKTPQLHGALPIPGHFAFGPNSPIHLLSPPVPPLASPWPGRLLLEDQHHLQLRWSLACSLRLQGGMQSYQASSQRAFRCFQCMSPGHQQGEVKGSPAVGGRSAWWMGSHRAVRVSASQPEWAPEMAPKHTWASASDTSPRARRHCTVKLQPGVLLASLKDLPWK